MKTLALWLGTLFCVPALAQTLELHLPAADVIVDATIDSVQAAQYRYRTATRTCGYIYKATVTETFRGGHSRRIAFGSNAPLPPQGRYLLLLTRTDGDFPTDSSVITVDPEDSGFHEALVKARKSCIASLPRLKTHSHPMGGAILVNLVPSRDERTLFVPAGNLVPGMRIATFDPAEILVDGRPLQQDPMSTLPPLPGSRPLQFTPWEDLRQWLLRNVPKKRPVWRKPTLASVTASLRRQLEDNRRHFADNPEALAAMAASQVAWDRFSKDGCNLVVSVWPDASYRKPLLQECQRQLAGMQATELELLRRTPAEYYRSVAYYFGRHECDDRCLAEELEEASEEMSDDLAHRRERFEEMPDILAAIDSSMTSSKALEGARCNLATAVWPDGALREATMMRCRLRSMSDWRNAVAQSDEYSNAFLREHFEALRKREQPDSTAPGGRE